MNKKEGISEMLDVGTWEGSVSRLSVQLPLPGRVTMNHSLLTCKAGVWAN